MKDKTIGIVGVGLMGRGIADNIQKHGWKIGFLDHSGNQPCDDLLQGGANSYDSLAALAKVSDVIILCVTGSPQVEDILTAEDGIIHNMRRDTVIIDCSTALPESTQRMAALVHDSGGVFLDAPMTRTPKEAAEGRLNLLVGGDRTQFDNHLPLLQSYAENITYAGDVGAGHALKLLHNYVSLGFSAVLAETAAAATKAGISPDTLHEVLAAGGGAGVVLERMTPFIKTGDTGSFNFSLANSAKDLGYYTKMCAELNAQTIIAESVSDTFEHQVQLGNGEACVPQLIDYLGTSCSE